MTNFARPLSWPVYLLCEPGGLAATFVEGRNSIPEKALLVLNGIKAARRCSRTQNRGCQMVKIESADRLRQFLHHLDPAVNLIAIQSEDNDTEQIVSKQSLLDQLPPPALVWDYPVHLLKADPGYASLSGATTNQQRFVALCVFTDEDNCRRFSERNRAHLCPVQAQDANELADIIAQLPQTTNAIVFDPPENPGGKMGRWCITKNNLLDILRPERTGIVQTSECSSEEWRPVG